MSKDLKQNQTIATANLVGQAGCVTGFVAIIIIAIAFGTVSFAHFASGYLSTFFTDFVNGIENPTTRNIFTFLSSSFFCSRISA